MAPLSSANRWQVYLPHNAATYLRSAPLSFFLFFLFFWRGEGGVYMPALLSVLHAHILVAEVHMVGRVAWWGERWATDASASELEGRR